MGTLVRSCRRDALDSRSGKTKKVDKACCRQQQAFSSFSLTHTNSKFANYFADRISPGALGQGTVSLTTSDGGTDVAEFVRGGDVVIVRLAALDASVYIGIGCL